MSAATSIAQPAAGPPTNIAQRIRYAFRDGLIALDEDGLSFRGADLTLQWPLDQITAVQPTSSALQIKARAQPVAAIRFLEGSVRLWEDRLQTAIRDLWRRAGRGEITEFQPCIRTR